MIGKWSPTQVSRLVGAANDIADRWRSDPFQRGPRFADGPPRGRETETPWPHLEYPSRCAICSIVSDSSAYLASTD